MAVTGIIAVKDQEIMLYAKPTAKMATNVALTAIIANCTETGIAAQGK